jgi:H+/Cl- antiporter ClcA
MYRGTIDRVGHPSRRSLREAVVHVRAGLALPVVTVGVAGGLVGAAYIGLLHLAQRLLGPSGHGDLATIAILVAVGAAVAVIVRIGGDTGTVDLLVDNIHVLGGSDDLRRTIPLIPASLLCVGAGGAMGPEAPLVQTTGTLGTWLGRRLGRDRVDRRVLTITGMAAGFTVLFGAPLGAALFALEILHRRGLQYYEALVPALVGSLCGYGVFVAVTGAGLEPVWRFPPVPALHGGDLVAAVAAGLVGALGAFVFGWMTTLARRGFGRLPGWARPALGGLALGLLALWSPYALTYGETQLAGLLDVRLAVGALAVAVVAKLLGTTVTLASGWKGGFIIPLFFMGAALGQLGHHLVPGVSETVLMASIMTALCVGVTKTPLGTTLVVTEMAGLPVLPMTLIAALVALLATSRVSVIETQRARADDRPNDAASEP